MLRKLLKDERGIEGLPMRLIIIVVIAAIVLAAVLALMKGFTPKGNLQVVYLGTTADNNNAMDSSGNLVKVNASGKGSAEIYPINFTAKIKVSDSEGNPVSGATVILSGAGTAGSNTTSGNGIAIVRVTGAKLDENVQSRYMKVTVKASNFHDYVEENGILLQRSGS